jgi:hypothetical protein
MQSGSRSGHFRYGDNGDGLNLPQFNGYFKKYTAEYAMKKKGVSDEKAEAVI